jgi:nucleoside-diphosphate-sugar epimerase
MSPTIYGTGSGPVNRTSIQVPLLIRTALKKGRVDVLGDGNGVWDTVHIDDLMLLYELLLAKVLEGENVPSGKRGIFFSETGDFTWLSLSQGLADSMQKQGLIKSNVVNHLTLQEAADQWANGATQYVELGFGSK